MVCPTPPKSTRTTCPYCGVGCGIVTTVDDLGAVSVRGDEEHPANFGRLCSKGSALAETLDLDGRLLEPEIDGIQVSWNTALERVAQTFKHTIQTYGPDSVAFYVSGQCLTEDYYVANKLMKGFIGSANIDTNSRLCMASSVAGHIRAFGSDTVPGVYEDLELADLIVLTGSNLAWCHPVLYQRIVAAKTSRPEMRIVVIDPRRTATCDIADLHLPIRPDTDVVLFLGLLRFLDQDGAINSTYIDAHTAGFEAALTSALTFDLETTMAATGINQTDLHTFYQWISDTEKTVTVYSQGVNQSISGTDKVNAIINTHLATGRIGRPGMGPFSVTGQPNAMGGREVGGLANQLAAHMQIENPDHRHLVQAFWSSPTIATKPGLKAVDLFKAISNGQVKAVWVMATNPVDSMPDALQVEHALQACPFVVVSDILKNTDTTRHANVLLPATGWGEKDGTVTNSERRISRQRKFLPSPGNAKPDWWALTEVARRMGWDQHFNYHGSADIFREHAALSAIDTDRARDFDIGAFKDVSNSTYETLHPIQWPARFTGISTGQNNRMFGDGKFYTHDGRANFVTIDSPPKRQPSARRLVLNTGRVRDHWHTMTRTGKSAKLSAHLAEPYAEITKSDAKHVGVHDAELVKLHGAKKSIVVRALVNDGQQTGTVFVPMHWTDQFTANGRINTLMSADADPISGQPGLKCGAVNITPFAAKWYGFAVSRQPLTIPDIEYWATSKTKNGWRAELAGLVSLENQTTFAENLFCRPLNPKTWRTYIDASHGIYRFAVIEDERLVSALFLDRKPATASRAWLAGQLGEASADTIFLSGRGGADRPDPGSIICACLGIGVNQINAAITNSQCRTTADIGAKTQAGTNCGSCLPEIRALLKVKEGLPITQ